MKNALIAAIVAAVVSVASATAATTLVITSKDIKDGTIQAVDLSAKAKTSLKGNRGPAGGPGLTGPAGSTGTAGAVAFRSLRRVGVQIPHVQPGTVELATATCPAGENAVSGGSAGGGMLLASFSAGNGWSAIRFNPSSEGTLIHVVFALCAPNVSVSLAP